MALAAAGSTQTQGGALVQAGCALGLPALGTPQPAGTLTAVGSEDELSDDDLVPMDDGEATATTTAILAASAAGGRKAKNGDAQWSEGGSWSYTNDVLPTINDVRKMAEIKQALSALECGGGGFSNAGPADGVLTVSEGTTKYTLR